MDMQKILEYRNARNRFCQRVGITVTELSPGYAKVVKTVTEDDLNPVDVAHGGRRGGHLSGAGEPVGKRGHQHHPQALIGEKPPERCSGGQFCIPPRGCKRNRTVFEHFLLFSFDLFCQSV